MSQSPLDSKNLTGLNRYQQGWKALNRLLHENKSFSGRETNNAFLNCGTSATRFADASSAIGWDFADDARAIATIDFDRDGDLDLWVTNRTAPRIRLLQNNLKSDSTFLALHLTGTAKKTNRDAIGARVVVHLKDQKPVSRSLHAGQSFLSQSSRWLHFGLGKKPSITKIVVHWPGANAETFTDLKPDTFYQITQGGNPVAEAPAKTPALTAGEATLPAATPIARIIPPSGHAFPPLPLVGDKSLTIAKDTLVILHSSTCPHCADQLTHLSKNKDLLTKSGLQPVILSSDQKPPHDFIKINELKLPIHHATVLAVETLDALQASFVDIWNPLPVPSSFLVSAKGEVISVYRGPAKIKTILADLALAKATPVQRRTAATPFTGQWIGEPTESNPQRAAQQLIQRNQIDAAITYLDHALKQDFVKGTDLDRGDNFLLLGRLLGQQGRPDEAVKFLTKARALLPDDLRVGRLLAAGFNETKRSQSAVNLMAELIKKHPDKDYLYNEAAQYSLDLGLKQRALLLATKAVKLSPSNMAYRFQLADLLLRNGDPKTAIAQYKGILKSQPRFLAAANRLALVLSTHPDEKTRSPQEALALARRLCQITKNQNPEFRYTLACARANLQELRQAEEILIDLQKKLPKDHQLVGQIDSALKKLKSGAFIRTKGWPLK